MRFGHHDAAAAYPTQMPGMAPSAVPENEAGSKVATRR
jgi:hypothetical protein